MTYKIEAITLVRSTKRAKKSLERVPKHVVQAYGTWERTVVEVGLAEFKKSVVIMMSLCKEN